MSPSVLVDLHHVPKAAAALMGYLLCDGQQHSGDTAETFREGCSPSPVRLSVRQRTDRYRELWSGRGGTCSSCMTV